MHDVSSTRMTRRRRPDGARCQLDGKMIDEASVRMARVVLAN